MQDWYKDAIIYEVHVRAFFDSVTDGIGDFGGLTQKLPYLEDLGVTAIWLLPFCPSPLKDDGYDTSDYTDIHRSYGTLKDFQRFMREAKRRGLRVITELVLNHTSDQHLWFQRSRHAPPGSRWRDFYVWSDTSDKYRDARIIFKDFESSNWTWDPVAKAYYWHRFYSHQPDLNWENPEVRKAMFAALDFWFDLGVDGLRLDAVPYLFEREGTNCENLPETHTALKELRRHVDEKYEGRMLLAEANQWPEDAVAYFGNGDECHMAFHFPIMPRLFMGLRMEDRHPITEILRITPPIPENCQWAMFLRNHDELTLEMVTDEERDYMYRTYAQDRGMRINLGIRRRLAPLLENDRRRIELMNALLLSLPGTPVLYYGDEIGMGDNIYLGDRNGVRTPMQWSPDRNAGFSRADPQRLYLPPIMDPIYGYQAVNVEAQSRDPGSLLNWMKRMLAVRKTSHAFGRGSLTFLRPGNRKVLAYLRELGEGPKAEAILCVANLSRAAQPVELDLKRFRGRVPVELLGRTSFPPVGDLPYLLTLPAYAFYWFRLAQDVSAPDWHKEMLVHEEAPVLVLFDGWLSFFRDKVVPWRIGMAEQLREPLEVEVLPKFIEGQRWYAQKGEPVRNADMKDHVVWDVGGLSWLITFVAVRDSPFFLPLALGWEEDEDHVRALSALAIAKVRQQANVGVMADAIADEAFCRHVVKGIGDKKSLPMEKGMLRFTPTSKFAPIAGDEVASLTLGALHTQSTNTSVTLGDRLFLKCFRRIRQGMHPELEVGRFLTEVARFKHCVPLAGSVEYLPAGGGESSAVALLQAYVMNQGDAWSYTLSYLERFVEGLREDENHAAYLTLIQTLATRTAELHRAFATPGGDPAFEPEPLTAQDVDAWRARVHQEAEETLRIVERSDKAKAVAAQRARILAFIDRCAAPKKQAMKTRHHGDYHLGQVLVSNNDFLIIYFEGEPSRPLAESRRKHTPLRDVAGMLRSFSYARGSTQLRERTEPNIERLVPALEAWERSTRKAFVEAYAAAMQASGIYESFDDMRGLLQLAEMEKVLYELRYEAANRPDWMHIPVQGLLALLDGA